MAKVSPRIRAQIWRERVVDVNDGILGIAGLLSGLATADLRSTTIIITATVAIAAGATSMAAMRYTEAAFNRDAIMAEIAEEKRRLALSPDEEYQELVDIYLEKGLSERLAHDVAGELTQHNALAAHMSDELDIDERDFEAPILAGLSAAIAFAVGAFMPAMIALVVPPSNRLIVTLAAVTISLSITSLVGAKFGHTHPVRTIVRAVSFGLLTLAIAASVGELAD
ncbi:VIT1/CCC1 transporter family protein [Branchiibius cervicis]|uniref:VIT1/CCC1 transporter family protein n=1 Tax=Branchiibius cervicis TaxID=908252 RepID=A0ABW2AXK5_9MICO